jgi:hypothetical protein
MQTSYDYEAPAAVLGLVTEDFHGSFRDTVIPQVAVKTGQLLTADKTPGKVRNAAKLPTTAEEITRPGAMGFVPLDLTRDLGDQDWPLKRPIAVLRRGRIWLLAETAVARWTYPFVRFAGVISNPAAVIRADADGANAAQLLFAITLTDADPGGLVLVEIDLY